MSIGNPPKRVPQTKAGLPNLRYMYPEGCICLSEGVHVRLAIEGGNIFNIFTCYLFANI